MSQSQKANMLDFNVQVVLCACKRFVFKCRLAEFLALYPAQPFISHQVTPS